MSKFVTLFFLSAIISNHSQAQENMLIGKISTSDLKEAPYSEWFVDGYDAYNFETAKEEDLKALLDGVNLKIFMGTWCSDSQREVPHFYRIMDALEFPSENWELFAVNREKTTPTRLEKNLDIRRVPTFIFYKDGKELGRIVEYPIVSLEDDMLKILSGEDYKHAYAQ